MARCVEERTSGTMSSMSSSSVVLEELCRCGEPGMLMGCVLRRAPAACDDCADFLSAPTTESELDFSVNGHL